MTDAEMVGLAAQALNLAKLDIERGRFVFVLASYHEGAPLHRMKTIERLIVERLGKKWLEYGQTKDLGFGMLRAACDILPPDALVIVTAGDYFKPTEKMRALPEAERRAVLRKGNDGNAQAVKDGLFTSTNCLITIVQNPERVCQYLQDVAEDGQVVGAPQTMFFPQDQFSGRLKMFGEHYDYSGTNNFTRKNAS